MIKLYLYLLALTKKIFDFLVSSKILSYVYIFLESIFPCFIKYTYTATGH